MGSGEVGGGGSVKWIIEFDDAIPKFETLDMKGKGKEDVGKSKGHGGFFQIRLKFAGSDDRDEAYESITKLGNNMIVMFVKAANNDPDQIRIDW